MHDEVDLTELEARFPQRLPGRVRAQEGSGVGLRPAALLHSIPGGAPPRRQSAEGVDLGARDDPFGEAPTHGENLDRYRSRHKSSSSTLFPSETSRPP